MDKTLLDRLDVFFRAKREPTVRSHLAELSTSVGRRTWTALRKRVRAVGEGHDHFLYAVFERREGGEFIVWAEAGGVSGLSQWFGEPAILFRALENAVAHMTNCMGE